VLGWDLAPDNLYAGIPHEDDRLAGQRMIAHVASTEFASSEVIRPAAVLSDSHARLILAGLAADDVQAGGHWWDTRRGVATLRRPVVTRCRRARLRHPTGHGQLRL